MTRLLAAVAFLTRLPIRRAFTAADVGRAAIAFPLVGAGIGVLQLAVWRLSEPYLTSLVTAALVVAFGAWVTRGLHWDGLADFVDGLGGGRTKEDALRIMKDSRIGAFGALALGLVLVLKIAAIEGLPRPEMLVLAPALSRWSVVALGAALPYVRPGSDSPSAHAGAVELVGATLMAGVLVVYLRSWLEVVVAIGVTVVVGAIARRRLGGVTGDVLGANVELAETAVLISAAV